MKGRSTTPEDRVLLSRFYQRQLPEPPVETTPAAVMADQTAECPPHHWTLDASNEGTCRKCGAQRQFPTSSWGAPEGTAVGEAAPGARDKEPVP